MGRQPCCDKVGLKRGPWTLEEDHKLMNFILNNGIQCWRMVPKLAGLLRCGKSCRLRWINYLRPDLKRGGFTDLEENQIIQLHARLGNRWSKIASHFAGRTDNEIKNHWNTRIKKKLKSLGLDPVTHSPIEQREKLALDVNEVTKQGTNIVDQNIKQQAAAPETTQVDAALPLPSTVIISAEDINNNNNNNNNDDTPNNINDRNSLSTDRPAPDRPSTHLLHHHSQQIEFSLEHEAADHRILYNCDMQLDGDYLDMNILLNQQFNPSTTNKSCTLSFGSMNATNSSTGDQEDYTSMQHCSLDSVDSMLSWDGFTTLQDDFFFLNNVKL